MLNPLYTYTLNVYDLVWLDFMAYQSLWVIFCQILFIYIYIYKIYVICKHPEFILCCVVLCCVVFFVCVFSLFNCELNFHDQNIWRTLTHDIRKHWTAFSTLLGLISTVYRDLHHWKSNQRPLIAEPKLCN